MNNTLMSLNNYLFEQLERINDDSLSDEELEKQIKKAEVINKTAENIIRNNETALKAVNIASEYGYIVPDNIREVLGIQEKPKQITCINNKTYHAVNYRTALAAEMSLCTSHNAPCAASENSIKIAGGSVNGK